MKKIVKLVILILIIYLFFCLYSNWSKEESIVENNNFLNVNIEENIVSLVEDEKEKEENIWEEQEKRL